MLCDCGIVFLLVILGDWIFELGYCVGCMIVVILEVMVVFVSSDEMVFGFICVLYEVGCSVLEDVLVVSVDDIVFVVYVLFVLMIVCQFFEVMGCVVVLCFIVQIEGYEVFGEVFLIDLQFIVWLFIVLLCVCC